VLVLKAWLRLAVARQVHFAVMADQAAIRPNQH
jgi:hypothetical protein